MYPPTARPLAPLTALLRSRRRRAAFRVPPLLAGPAPRCATGGGVLGGKTPRSVPTLTTRPMADWVGPCSAGRKARRPRASRDVAGRRKGLFPSLELRIRPRQNSRRRLAGAPERLPQGRRSSGARRPRAFYRRTLAFWERPSSESPSLDASLPRFPPKWAGCAPGSKGKGRRAPESLQSGSSEWAGDQEGVGRPSAAGLHPSTGPPCRWAAPMVPWIS